jgi:hypothetical protein
MASTTTFGNLPGVQVTTTGNAITGIIIGREQKTIIIGQGKPGTNVSVNEPTQIDSRLDADRKFGSDTELANAMRAALANGASIDSLYGILYDGAVVSNESFSGTDDGQLQNRPIIENKQAIAFTDTVASNTLDIEFKYENGQAGTLGTLPSPDPDTVYINPITGDWRADSSSDFEVDYAYSDIQSAQSAAESIIDTEESALIAHTVESESVAQTVSGSLNTIRPDYKMAMGVQAAEPNVTTQDGAAHYNAANYANNIDNDAMFLFAPGRLDGSTELITGAMVGLMSGNQFDNSIYRDSLTTGDLDQRLTTSQVEDLRDADVIPVKQPQSGGTVEVMDSISTSQATDWQRDYFTRRIVDQVILLAKAIGDSILGRINDEQTRQSVRDQIRVELTGLANDRLLKQNTDDEENWFVEVYEVDANTVGIDIGITPTGVAKRIEVQVAIDT